MKTLLIVFGILHLFQFSIIAKDVKGFPKAETQDEKDWREFKEFQRMRERQEREGVSKEDKIDLVGSTRKKWFLFLQGGNGSAATQYENGRMQFGKAGFEYRTSRFLGVGLSLGNNSLDLRSRDNSSSLLIAYYLLSAYNETSTSSPVPSQVNQLLFASIIDSPVAFFYLSNTFSYRYNTAHLDFNIHFNGEKFFDPFIGFSLIGGVCPSTYACLISGGELKLGAQLNFESFFTFAQLQGQFINIKEPGFAPFQSQHSIGSIGIGIKF